MTKSEILSNAVLEISVSSVGTHIEGIVEHAMESYATAQTAELQKEVERLKGLVEKAHIEAWEVALDRNDDRSRTDIFQEFKTDNNL